MTDIGDRVGFLTWYTVPDIAAPYEELRELADAVGFPEDCVPTPPEPRNAWQRATSTGGRGISFDPPAELSQQIQQDYGSAPKVRLVTRVISSRSPQLVRHLVREAIVSTAENPRQQLDLGTVAVLKFDTTTGESKLLVVDDPLGYVNGGVSEIVAKMDEEMERLMHNATGDEVRYGLRRLLERLFGISQRGTGGVYFVPASAPDASELLTAMREYVNALRYWRVGDPPACNVVTLQGGQAYDEIRDSVMLSVQDEYTERIEELAEMVKPVIEGRAKGKVADRINRNAIEEWRAIYDGLGAYRLVLRDELERLSEIFEWMTATVQQSASQSWDSRALVDTFREYSGANETVRRVL